MATVNSLICWGGRTGKTVTLTIASPCVVTLTNHGLRDGARLVFSTTGALPTGITAGTAYYAKSTAANTFNLYADAALTSIVNTSGTQSGTHTAKSVLMAELFAKHPGRWGDSGSERCYDGLSSWNSGRSGASLFDYEVCELGEAFTDTCSTLLTISVPSARITVTASVSGISSTACHFGVIGAGYIFTSNYGYSGAAYLTARMYDCEFSGFTIKTTSAGGRSPAVKCNANSVLRRMIITGYGLSNGVVLGGFGVRVTHCLIYGFSSGVMLNYGFNGTYVDNCIVTKNTNGVDAVSTAVCGFWYNNIVVGNSGVNWKTGVIGVEGASNNAGLSGEAWVTGTGTRITIATSDFVDYTNNDFRALTSTSPQVDAGFPFYGVSTTDILGGEVPNYNNGGAEGIDIGCYEYDHGYGNHPASTIVTFLGVVSGSEIHVYDSEDNELVGTESCTANQSLTWGIPTNPNVKITIIKRGLRWMKFTYLSEEGPQTIPIFPQPDLGYNNPA